MKVKLGFVLRYVALIKTLRVNLALFPLGTALKLPILCGPHCDISGLRRGAVVLTGRPRLGMIIWGVSRYPIFSTKGLWTLIRFGKGGTMTCGEAFYLRAGGSLIVTGRLVVGKDVTINQRTVVACHRSVTIGAHARIGWDVQIGDSDNHMVYREKTNRIQLPYKAVSIGRNVWIGSRSIIGKGTVLPDCSIVGCGALVNRDFGSVTTRGNLFAGVPATLKATGVYLLIDHDFDRTTLSRYKNTDETEVEAPAGFDLQAMLDPPLYLYC